MDIPKSIIKNLDEIKKLNNKWKNKVKSRENKESTKMIYVFILFFTSLFAFPMLVGLMENMMLSYFIVVGYLFLCVLIFNYIEKKSKISFKEELNEIRKEIIEKIKIIESSDYGYTKIFETSIESFRYINKNLSKEFAKYSMKFHKRILSGDLFSEIKSIEDEDILKKQRELKEYEENIEYVYYVVGIEHVNEKNENNNLKILEKLEEKKRVIIKEEREELKSNFKEGIKNFFGVKSSIKEEKINKKEQNKKDYFKIKSL